MGARVTSRSRNGRREVVVYWRDPLGRRHVRFFGQDADKAEEFRAQVDGPLPAEAHAPTLAVWARRWLERIERLVSAGSLRPPTLRNYRTVVNREIAGHWLGTRKLEGLHRRDVKAWTEELVSRLAPRTVRLYVAVLRACLGEAAEEGYVKGENPAKGIVRAMRLPSGYEPPEAPGVEATAAILGALEGESLAACSVILYLGLRLGEALGLQWEDVDFGAREATIRRQVYPSGEVVGLKSRAGKRTVEIPHPMVEFLQRLRAERADLSMPWVLGVDPKGAAAARQRWRLGLRRAAKAVGFRGRVWLHGLRHTHAVGKLEAGADLDTLKRGMGHSTVRLTSDYYGAHAQRKDANATERFGEAVAGSQLRLFRRKG